MREEEQESDRAYSRLQRHQPLSEYKHEERKGKKKKGGGGMGRGERNGLQMLVPSLPLFPHPHARILRENILRETSAPCSFSSTRPPGSTNRRGLLLLQPFREVCAWFFLLLSQSTYFPSKINGLSTPAWGKLAKRQQ